MNAGHLFECVMLICFGFSWPLNVIKAYKARSAKGTSLAFIVLIITGYVAGITAKFMNHQLNYVLAVYFLNLAIVLSNVVVYIRNCTLDRKAEVVETKNKIYDFQQKYKNTNKSISLEENMNYQELNKLAKVNQVVLLGGSLDKEIIVAEMAKAFNFNFELYNRSLNKISVKEAKAFFEDNVAALKPEGIILHIGDEDISMFQNNSSDFDKCYVELIAAVKKCNKKCRIAVVSVRNTKNDKVIASMNAHIKAIASSERVDFVNLDNVQLWNPKATKAATDFAYNMGLNIRKPLINVSEILYSYAYLEMKTPETNEVIAG